MDGILISDAPRLNYSEASFPMTTKQADSNPGPLTGMRVLELAQIMAGPTCGMMLADMGADVIKVEKLPGGDDARAYHEPRVNGVSAPFMILNRNKRGIALNLKLEKGREILLRMVKEADVLTENYRRGTLERLGLGYDVLSAINPGLIYCSVSGYGRDGPYGDKGGFDLIAQGFSGLMSITGEPGGRPAKTGNSIADINAGLLAVVGITAAYAHKLKTGQGQVVDTSLMEAALQQTYWHSAIYFATGQSPGPTGSAHLLAAPYQAFRASDGWINIGGANQANWERIAEVLGHPEWRDDPRYATNTARMQNLSSLTEAMGAVLVTRSRAEWMEAFDAAGVPVGPIHTIGEALTHPQTLARAMVVELVHPQAGPTKALGCPVHFSKTPTRITRHAPMLGEHSRELLREYGYSEAEIDGFVREGVIEEARV
jgi:crotonobetainyl-CoA:carnitine CoA-transferase CaiB-like acyl-CoA transferase